MRVAVIGAGIIGLTCAYELMSAGHAVEVFDPDPACGATFAAAGMLSPAGEAWFGEERLLELGLASMALWPEFAARLQAASGTDPDHRRAGTLLVGQDRDDLADVHRTMALLADQGIESVELSRGDLLDREPALSPMTSGGILLPGDHSVNPRAASAGLRAILGTRLRAVEARPEVSDGRCVGVHTGAGERRDADAVVVAAGHRLGEFVPDLRRAIRPVRGEILRARTDDPPQRTIRASVHGRPVYVVPRAGGEVVIGATSEERGGEPIPTVGGVRRLLDAATALLPTLETADILDVTCRFRPGTPDNGPLIGPSSTEGLFVAGGHYRGGVLLAPITAVAVRAHLEGAEIPAAALPFLPERFAKERSTR